MGCFHWIHICCLLLLMAPISCREHDVPITPVEGARESTAQAERVRLPIPTEEPIVRVRIRRVIGSLEPVEFAHGGQEVTISDETGNTITRQGPLTVRRDRKGWIVRASDTWKLPRSIQSASWISLMSRGGLELTDDSGETRQYAGSVRCVHLPDQRDTTWDLIEHVGIESYLPGVLSGELFGHWGKQCQAAQAIAARSFVTMECILRKGRRWDVVDTPGSQVYLGVVGDNVSHEACEMTRGMVLTWGPELVPGYFSSCCGGRAATGSEAIGPNPINSVPPLKGHMGDGYCQEAPLYKWKRECSGADLGAAIRRSAPKGGPAKSIGTVDRIIIIGRNRHGRGIRLQVRDTAGRKIEMTAEDLLQSSRSLPEGPLFSGWVEGRRKGGRLHLSGHGYGHGAGLCQYGTAAMDSKGMSFWKMIEYYYPGAEIKRAW
ncbi:MAG: SpoIID/LytB domain-containing protein [Phycisphaerales bacterium]|nr:SpoIID/LytB domain-containing protein [Phycisphaerales bacterium]